MEEALNLEQFKTVPYEHQWKTLDCSWNLPAFGLFWEMGTGKTKTILDNAAWLHRAGKISRLLVIAPKGVYVNWISREIPTHLPDGCNALVVKWQPNQTQAWLREWNRLGWAASVGRLKVFVMNVEALSTTKGETYATEFCKAGSGDVLCVVDESTTIKSWKAVRTKAACRVGALCKYRRILTGTPTPRDPLDLWSQFKFLSGAGDHLLGHETWFSFRARYARMQTVWLGRRTVQLVLGWRHKEELADRVARHSSRIRKEECLDLPPKIYEIREVEATPEQVKAYSEMAEDLMTYLDGVRIDATIALVKLQKLQQIMCGFAMDRYEVVHELKHNRLDELVRVIDEIDPDESVIVWAHYCEAIMRIWERLTKEYPESTTVTYYGETSEKDREQAIRMFQNGEARFFVANPQSGGYGLTLTRGSHVIYYSRGYDWAQRSQSEDRCHRIGQEKKVLYVDLITPGSIEVEILEALRNKMTLTADLLREKAQEWIGPLASFSGNSLGGSKSRSPRSEAESPASGPRKTSATSAG